MKTKRYTGLISVEDVFRKSPMLSRMVTWPIASRD